MEELFKQNLLNLRHPPKPVTFGEALFPNTLWKPRQANKSPKSSSKIVVSEEFSEKKQVIESFERFAQEKLDTAPEKVMKILGGEIALKAEASWEGVSEFENTSRLMESLTLPPAFLKHLLNNKTPGQVKVIFVTETFRSYEEASKDFKEGFINELLTGFSLKTAELFERMITAMNLLPEEVVLYPVDFEDQDLSTEIMSLAGFMKPEVVVTLGAKATQKILKINDRLTLIHGQFYPRTLKGLNSFQVVPLFHPSIIETNQNMKKTAWTDMQKIMKHLKKLS